MHDFPLVRDKDVKARLLNDIQVDERTTKAILGSGCGSLTF